MTTLETARPRTDETVERIRAALQPVSVSESSPVRGRLYADVPASSLREAVRIVFEELEGRYLISVGRDARAEGAGFEVLHMFSFDRDGVRVAVRAPVGADHLSVPSVTPIVPGAGWAEREIRDLFGVHFEDHPDPRRLVLPNDFPDDVHPLRKDVPYDYRPPENGNKPYPFKKPPEGTSTVQLGPFFPILEEPSQWRLYVDGETVVDADYRGFFCHRAIEKLGDSVLSYNDVISLAERICGICGCVHSSSYCQTVEEAAGLTVPLRARVIRTLMLEIERLQSHLLWLGLACHIVGFDFVFMQSWRLREPLMALAETLSGSRKHFAVNVVGGVTFDVTGEKHRTILDAMDTVERDTLALVKAIQGDEALIARLKGVGILTRDEIRQMGVVGPTARGSGVPMDVRRDHPYAAYDIMQFDVVTHDGCDVLGRTLVRALEIFEAIKIVRQCVEHLRELPPGDLLAEMPDRLPPHREGMHAVEAPRGEVFHYVRTGERNGPDRWRVRAPSYQNIQAAPVMFKPGTLVADVPIAIGSVDPCFSCTERVELVDRSGDRRIWTRDDLENHARRDMRRRRGVDATEGSQRAPVPGGPSEEVAS